MRSLELLAKNYPDKTGSELLAMQEADKKAGILAREKEHEANIKFIKDINTNGGYYIGRFGLERYMYSFHNLSLSEDGFIDCYVHVLTFVYDENKPSLLHCTIKDDYTSNIDLYLGDCERVDKSVWDKITNYLISGKDLWNEFMEIK